MRKSKRNIEFGGGEEFKVVIVDTDGGGYLVASGSGDTDEVDTWQQALNVAAQMIDVDSLDPFVVYVVSDSLVDIYKVNYKIKGNRVSSVSGKKIRSLRSVA